MPRKLILGALVSLALGSFGSASAQAEWATLTANKYPATVTATQIGENVFKFGPWQISCAEASFNGTLMSESTGVQISQSYGNCATTNSLPVTVRINGCEYAWKLNELEGPGTAEGFTSGTCGGGKMLEFDVYESAAKHNSGSALCTYGVPPQPVYTVQAHNSESGGVEDVQLTINLSGFEVKVLKGTVFFCGAGLGGTVSGTYTGTQTLSATNEDKAVSLMVG